MKKILLMAAVLFVVSIAALKIEAKDKIETLSIGGNAPEVSVEIVNTKEYGKKFSLADFKDKVVVLEFWATWCPPCRESIPHLSKLQEEHGDKIIVIGVSTEGKKDVEKFYKKQENMKYRVAVDKKEKTSKTYMEGFGVNGIPHAFIIKEGKILWHGHPMEMDKELGKALSSGPGAGTENKSEKKTEEVKDKDVKDKDEKK